MKDLAYPAHVALISNHADVILTYKALYVRIQGMHDTLDSTFGWVETMNGSTVRVDSFTSIHGKLDKLDSDTFDAGNFGIRACENEPDRGQGGYEKRKEKKKAHKPNQEELRDRTGTGVDFTEDQS